MSRAFTQSGRRGGKAMRSALGDVFRPTVPTYGAPKVAPAKGAKFAPDPQRRVMVAKIQIARKDMDFDEGDYRALLERITGKTSSTAMSIAELGQVLDELKRMGWAPRQASGPAAGKSRSVPKPADHPSARKARAMLISLGLLGVIRNPTEAALEAFARRQMGVERLQWADQAQVYKLIEALKAIAERHGWEQSVAGLEDPIWTLKLRLCGAIARRCIAAGALAKGATVATLAASELGLEGQVALTQRDLERLATHLGGLLAAHAHAEHYEGA